VKFWLIVAARLTNASEKLLRERARPRSATLGGVADEARALADASASASRSVRSGQNSDFFLAMKKK
jgi:hypothetical protein